MALTLKKTYFASWFCMHLEQLLTSYLLPLLSQTMLQMYFGHETIDY